MNKLVLGSGVLSAGILLLIILITTTLFLDSPNKNEEKTSSPEISLPNGAFTQPQEAYLEINGAPLSLPLIPPPLQLPDLHEEMTFYGINGRPDADPAAPVLYFGCKASNQLYGLQTGQPLYLVYDKTNSSSRYLFSPDNTPTPLWITASAQGDKAFVQVNMKNPADILVTEPKELSNFILTEKEFLKDTGPTAWEIGHFRVDNSLLARQRARWMGCDLFLEKHGGAEYAQFAGKQRMDFGEDDEGYFCFLGTDDCLIWNGEQWEHAVPGPETRGYPLLRIKWLEERVVLLELWELEGRGKVLLNLLKMNDSFLIDSVQNEIKFVGLKTLRQFILELEKQRVVLKPQDWLLRTKEGWKKLSTKEEIDDYVSSKLTGELLVFDSVLRKEGRQVLLGHVFNSQRTEIYLVEFPLQKSLQVVTTPPQNSQETEDNRSTENASSRAAALSALLNVCPLQEIVQAILQK